MREDFSAWVQPQDPEEAARKAHRASAQAMRALAECRADGLLEAQADRVACGEVWSGDAADEVVQTWERTHGRLTTPAWALLRRIVAAELEALAIMRGWFGGRTPTERGRS